MATFNTAAWNRHPDWRPGDRTRCSGCMYNTLGSLDNEHCKGKRGYCKCKCDPKTHSVTCWQKGCRKQKDLMDSPFGRLCPEHVENAVRWNERNSSFLAWYKRYRKINAPRAPRTVRVRVITKEEREAQALAKQRELIATIKSTLENIEAI